MACPGKHLWEEWSKRGRGGGDRVVQGVRPAIKMYWLLDENTKQARRTIGGGKGIAGVADVFKRMPGVDPSPAAVSAYKEEVLFRKRGLGEYPFASLGRVTDPLLGTPHLLRQTCPMLQGVPNQAARRLDGNPPTFGVGRGGLYICIFMRRG